MISYQISGLGVSLLKNQKFSFLPWLWSRKRAKNKLFDQDIFLDTYSEKYNEVSDLARSNVKDDRLNVLQFGQESFELQLSDGDPHDVTLNWATPPIELVRWLSNAKLDQHQIFSYLSKSFTALDHTLALSNATNWVAKWWTNVQPLKIEYVLLEERQVVLAAIGINENTMKHDLGTALRMSGDGRSDLIDIETVLGLFELIDPDATLVTRPKYNQSIHFIPEIRSGLFKSPSLEKLGPNNAFAMDVEATKTVSISLTEIKHLEGVPTVFCCYDRSWGLIASLEFQNSKQLVFISEFGSVGLNARAKTNITITLGEKASFNIDGEELNTYGVPKFIIFGSSLTSMPANDALKIGAFRTVVQNRTKLTT